MDWTRMSEAARERQGRARASRAEVQGIRNALSVAFDGVGCELPEEFRRLLQQLR